MQSRQPVGQDRTSKMGHVEFPVIRVAGRYRVRNLLGSGTFGKCSLTVYRFYSPVSMLGNVYLGKDLRTGKEVALKVELHDRSYSNLCHEYDIYKDIAGCPGIPRAYWCGTEGKYDVMVMDRYELSLDDMVRQSTLDIHTVVSFAGQMVSVHAEIYRVFF